MSALSGPCFRLAVEYLPRWFEPQHSAVSSFFLFWHLHILPSTDGKDGNGILRGGVSVPRREAAAFGRSGSTVEMGTDRDRGAVSLEQVLWFVAAGVSVAVIATILWNQIRDQANTPIDEPEPPTP